MKIVIRKISNVEEKIAKWCLLHWWLCIFVLLEYLLILNLTLFSQLLFFQSKIDFASVSKKWKESPISLWDISFADFSKAKQAKSLLGSYAVQWRIFHERKAPCKCHCWEKAGAKMIRCKAQKGNGFFGFFNNIFHSILATSAQYLHRCTAWYLCWVTVGKERAAQR